MSVSCLFCGKPIPQSKCAKALYCSGYCRRKAQRIRDEQRQPAKKCVICGKEFRAKSGNKNQKTCSYVCGREFMKRNIANRKARNDVPEAVISWSEVFRTAEKYHPERFIALHLDRPEYQAEVIQRFTSELISWEKTDRYAWFYNHVLYPDDILAETIGDGLLMIHAVRSANEADFIGNGVKMKIRR